MVRDVITELLWQPESAWRAGCQINVLWWRFRGR